MQDKNYHFDVIIVGAGPAGTTCALALQNSGLKIAIIDKAVFPRDKVCGDAIPTRAVTVLKKINPKYFEALAQFEKKEKITTSRVVVSSGKELFFHWKSEAFNCARFEFDNFLFDFVKKETQTSVFENTEILSIKIQDDVVVLDTYVNHFTTSIVIGCDGAHSIVAKKLANFKVNKKMFSGAVRSYQQNIPGNTVNTNEVFFSQKYTPGYFWLFPVSEHSFNIGFGMLSEIISLKKINLKKAMVDVVTEFPELSQRFTKAGLEFQTDGFGLPMGNGKTNLSGNRFLLCGDAGSLIDPISGAGIGNAMESSFWAANHVIKYFSNSNFDAQTNKNYDRSVYREIGKELKKNMRILRLSSKFPWLVNLTISCLAKNNFITKYFKKGF